MEKEEELSQEKKNNEQHIFPKSAIPDNTEIVNLQDFLFLELPPIPLCLLVYLITKLQMRIIKTFL